MELLKPLLKPSHAVNRTENGDIAIGEVGPHSYLVRKAPDILVDLLLLLDGTRTVHRITRSLRPKHDVTEEQVAELLRTLDDAGLLEDGARESAELTGAERERYDRQLLQFSVYENERQPGFVYQERLKSQVVCVLGMGGWGTWLTLNLALAGFGTIRVVDGDYVELSNLNRQVLYDDSSVGSPKVAAAKKAVNRINPHVAVETVQEFVEPDAAQVERILDGVSLICVCWANKSHFVKNAPEELVHRYAFERGIPVLEVAGDPFDIAVGPLYPNDGSGPCLRCVRGRMQQLWFTEDDTLTSFRKATARVKPLRKANAWQSAPSLSAIAGMAASELLTVATGYTQPGLTGRRLNISMRSFATSMDEFAKDPSCEWCSPR